METQRFIECSAEFAGEHSNRPAHALDRNRTKLLGLGLGISVVSRRRCRQQDLEGVHVLGVRAHRDNGYDLTAEALSRTVRTVVAYDHFGAARVGFGASDWIQVDQTDLTRRIG